MRLAVALLLGLLCVAGTPAQPAPPADLVCEWRPGPAVIRDPCPEFAWVAPEQSRCHPIISSTRDRADRGEGNVWDSGLVEGRVPVAEYAGPALEEGPPYWWCVRVAAGDGEFGAWSAVQEFRYERSELPRRLSHVRTFVNFGGDAEVVASRYDLTFRKEAKQLRPEVIALNYSLLCTMVVPSEKAEALADFCVVEGLGEEGIPEDMFLHFGRDTEVTLHVGAERAENPRETRTIPGWDPANDRDDNGRVDDAEAADLRSPEATARERSQARVPIYYWGPPRDDFVMDVGDPGYRRFCAEAYVPSRLEGFDGIWADTMPGHIPGPGANADILEYPREDADARTWRDDLIAMLVAIKRAHPETLFLANSWNSVPFVIDGVEHENWLNVASPLSRVEAALDSAVDRERRGIMQMLQVNPVYHPEENEFGVKADVELDRDRIFALALHYLIAGEQTYFGYGQHPYRRSEEKWFPAIEYDVGQPTGERRVFAESPGTEDAGPNLLANGDFEADADGDGNPDGWDLVEPVDLDAELGDGLCARIDSDTHEINNINRQYVTLKPHTTYTLSARVKTNAIAGGQGAQVYPYEFDGATGAGIGIVMRGTRGWTPMSQVLTTGDDAEGRINFRIYGSTGTAWLDDIRLVEGDYGPWRVLAREFGRALVLVKPFAGGSFGDATATVHSLPGPMRPLHADGSLAEPQTDATLRSGEAAILVR